MAMSKIGSPPRWRCLAIVPAGERTRMATVAMVMKKMDFMVGGLRVCKCGMGCIESMDDWIGMVVDVNMDVDARWDELWMLLLEERK